MSDMPTELHYTKTHEWVRINDDGTLTIGITDHAQNLLGDLVFVEMPEPGVNFKQGDDCAVVESVKAASDIYCPIAGKVIGSNQALDDSPELINQDVYGQGWIFTLKPEDAADVDSLLDAKGYSAFVASEEH